MLQEVVLLDENAKKSKNKLQQVVLLVRKANRDEKGANHRHASMTATRPVPVQILTSSQIMLLYTQKPKISFAG